MSSESIRFCCLSMGSMFHYLLEWCMTGNNEYDRVEVITSEFNDQNITDDECYFDEKNTPKLFIHNNEDDDELNGDNDVDLYEVTEGLWYVPNNEVFDCN